MEGLYRPNTWSRQQTLHRRFVLARREAKKTQYPIAGLLSAERHAERPEASSREAPNAALKHPTKDILLRDLKESMNYQGAAARLCYLKDIDDDRR